VYGLEPLRGDASLAVLEGRLPAAKDEIALGAQSLRSIGRDIGDTVSATTADGRALTLRVVGRTIFPSLSLDATYGISEGATMTTDGLQALVPDVGPSFFLVDLRDGVELADVRARYGEDLEVEGVQRPGDITSYARVRATPLVLAGLLGVLGIGVLVHLLMTSIRNRRRDLAVLKTLGCTRRQLRRAVAWQATLLVLTALAVGVPLGALAGRLIWLGFADDLGVGRDVITPSAAFVAIAAAALIIGNVVALLPARSAARTRAGAVLAVRDR
jgi:putative ABC transport system permease protein